MTAMIDSLLTYLHPLMNAASDYPFGFGELAAGSALVFAILVSLAMILGIYALVAIFYMKLFAKANVPAWKAWVPIVNMWKFLELGGYPGAISLLTLANLIPCIGSIAYIVCLVFMCMAAYQIGLKLGQDGAWVVLYIFVAIVWLGIMAFNKAIWNDSLGKPALGPERPPTWPPYNSGVPPYGGGVPPYGGSTPYYGSGTTPTGSYYQPASMYPQSIPVPPSGYPPTPPTNP